MPNWANTNIIFFSNDEKQLQELYSVIFYRAPNAYVESIKPILNSNSIGSGWLGAILYELKEIKRITDAFAAEDNSDSWCYINIFETPEIRYGL